MQFRVVQEAPSAVRQTLDQIIPFLTNAFRTSPLLFIVVVIAVILIVNAFVKPRARRS